ncbi:MAG: chorismate mutase [Eubacteriales bacterium]|nr:chorismate mutase [Eubacteriales bacterium]
MIKCDSLEEVRKQIDRIDEEIVKLIAERGKYVMQVVSFKNEEEGVRVPAREAAVIQKVRNRAEEYGADPDMMEALYREMIARFVDLEIEELRRKT